MYVCGLQHAVPSVPLQPLLSHQPCNSRNLIFQTHVQLHPLVTMSEAHWLGDEAASPTAAAGGFGQCGVLGPAGGPSDTGADRRLAHDRLVLRVGTGATAGATKCPLTCAVLSAWTGRGNTSCWVNALGTHNSLARHRQSSAVP